jgi:predicted nuclease of restriction endonuclease-like (RecB) superfamily
MKYNLTQDKTYKAWLAELKGKILSAQLKAAVAVNTQLLKFYWELGADIVEKQKNAKWGDGLVEQLSRDLMSEFPEMKGFSRTNLMYVKKWCVFYGGSNLIVPQPVGQTSGTSLTGIFQIPWGHNREIITSCKSVKEALFYVHNTAKYNWSRSVLVHQIESGLYAREGKAPNNFAAALPKPQSDLARQTLKDPYIFDFLNLTKEHNERELENALVEHITRFLLELGAGFAYVGRQVPLRVGDSDFYIDLLFYHLKLRSYVVIELKTTAFEPEFAGKLNFYLTAVDRQVRSAQDNPTIGILICKKKSGIIAEYALSDIRKPIGVSEYKLTQSLPKSIKSSLPSIKEIEKELGAKK